MKEFRGLLVAVVLLAALGGAYWFSEKDQKAKEGQPAKDAPPKIVVIPENEISGLELRKKGGETTVLKRTGNISWSITAPKALSADPDAMMPLLNLLSSLASDGLVDEKVQDWAQYGLKEPSFEVVITKKDGKTTTLQLGDDLPAGAATFARIAGESKLYTVASYNRNSLDKSWKDLRDKRLFTAETDKISRIELNGVEFGKNQSNEWQIIKPNAYRADNLAVEEASRKLKDLKMDPNLSDEDAAKQAKAFAGAKPVGVAKLTDAAGTQQLEVRKAGNDYLAKSSVVDGVHKVSADVGALLEKKLDDYRNRKLFDFGFSDPSKIEVKIDGVVKSYGKSGEKWFLDGKEMKPETVQNLIDKFRELNAGKFTAGSKETPTIELTVVSNEGKRTEVVKIAGTLAARGDEPFQYDIGPTLVDDIKTAAKNIAPADAAKPAAGGDKKK